MGYKTRVHGTVAQIGNVYQKSQPGQRHLSARAGKAPNDRVAMPRERSLVDEKEPIWKQEQEDHPQLSKGESKVIAKQEAALKKKRGYFYAFHQANNKAAAESIASQIRRTPGHLAAVHHVKKKGYAGYVVEEMIDPAYVRK